MLSQSNNIYNMIHIWYLFFIMYVSEEASPVVNLKIREQLPWKHILPLILRPTKHDSW